VKFEVEKRENIFFVLVILR